MNVVYVAGPFRAKDAWEIEQNIRRAETLALEVWRAGHAAICPHTGGRYYQGAAPDDMWLKGDFAILERCDAVLLVEGWQNSSGTLQEVEHAEGCGIPLFKSLDKLNEYLGKGKPKSRDDVLKMLGQASDFDEMHLSVATSRSAAYRQALSWEAWSLLHDLFRDLRQGARGKGMMLTERLAPVELSEKILDELADALYKEMRDRGIDLDAAFA